MDNINENSIFPYKKIDVRIIKNNDGSKYIIVLLHPRELVMKITLENRSESLIIAFLEEQLLISKIQH